MVKMAYKGGWLKAGLKSIGILVILFLNIFKSTGVLADGPPPPPDVKILVIDSIDPNNDLNVPFCDVKLGSSSSATLTIINQGANTPLEIGDIAKINPLSEPFSLEEDNCSGAFLDPDGLQSCTITVTFSPTSLGDFEDSFEIQSNDPSHSTLSITVSGKGVPAIVNKPHSLPFLIYPTNGQTGVTTLPTLKWKKSLDPEASAVTYELYLSDDPNFSDCNAIAIGDVAYLNNNHNHLNHNSPLYAKFTRPLIALGMVVIIAFLLLGFVTTEKKIRLLAIFILTGGIFLMSCGESLEVKIAGDEISYTLTDELEPETIYYWKVTARDEADQISESQVWSFTTY